jgi:hypothetical protein
MMKYCAAVKSKISKIIQQKWIMNKKQGILNQEVFDLPIKY